MKTLSFLLFIIISPLIVAENHRPICQELDSDVDGDGWGWENGTSCIVEKIEPAEDYCLSKNVTCINVPTIGDDNNLSRSADCDYTDASEHNGYGWNNVTKQSCPPIGNDPSEGDASQEGCDYTNSDVNNGWGWNNALKESCPPLTSAPASPKNKAEMPKAETRDVVTILVGGQSNALGERTEYNANIDATVDNLIVFTNGNEWRIADPCSQTWVGTWYPRAGGNCSNHPAFQIGLSMAKSNLDKLIAVIPTGVAGQRLSCWNENGNCLILMDNRVNLGISQLAAIYGKETIDYFAFLQGESNQGEASQWQIDVYNFIDRMQSRYWWNSQTKFVMSETFKAHDINEKIRFFGIDSRNNTDFVLNEGLTAKDNTHWSGQDLRILGDRFARKFND